MLPRTIKRYSSSSSASARAGIKNIIFGGSEHAQAGVPAEELSYQTKTFEDGDASPVGGSPFGSRRSSLSSAAAGAGSVHPSRRSSLRASLMPSMTAITPDSAGSGVSARAFSSASVSSGLDHPSQPQTPGEPLNVNTSEVEMGSGTRVGRNAEGSLEHGAYQFTPKELAAVKKRVEEEFLLKSVTRTPLAKHRRPSGKVPYEHEDSALSSPTEPVKRHPSGFIVPDPHLAPSATPTLQTDVRPRPATLNRGIPESVLTFADLKELATAEVSTRSEKVPQEVRAPDGRVMHPSGFVPPTPQGDHGRMEQVKELFKPAVNLDAPAMSLAAGNGGTTHK